jgi:hypothetical protein
MYSELHPFTLIVPEIITGKRYSGFHQHGDFLNCNGYV